MSIAVRASAGANHRNSSRAALVLIWLFARSQANSAYIATLNNLHEVQVTRGVSLEALHHAFEHVEGLTLVLNQRILLSVTAEADALLQVIHIEQLIFPLLVEH